MEVKQLTVENIPQIILLEKDHAPDRPYYAKYDEEALQFIFDNPRTCRVFGLFDQNNFVGWGCYRTQWSEYNSQEQGVYEIGSIVIHSNYRRQGLGKKLLDKLFEDIKKQQWYKKIYLTVSPKNIGALLLYLTNGFEIYDFKKNVYGERADRLYLMKE